MANLRETSVWETGIYQWETSDPVMGGENGIDNKPTLQLANRTLWLKNEIAKAVESIGSNKTAADSALATKAAAATQMIAGNGLTGGGTLADNRTLTLGTPSSITASSTNSVTTTSHTHAIDQASTSTAGIVQLSTATNSTATNMAATPSAVKAAYDLAASKASPATTLAGYGITDWVVGAKYIDSSVDLNTITATGIYFQSLSANASVTLNYPEARAGTLEVMYAYGYMQRYTTTTGRIYLRVYNGGWGAWNRLDGLDAASAATTITAGNGLTGGGTLADNRTLTLGTPSSITASSTNSVTTTSHTHAIDQASTSTAGIVQLSTATNSTATNMAATPSAVKAAYDLAVSKADLSDFASLRAGNGYQKLPNGLILQWGSVSIGVDSAVNITFPIAFPNAVLNAQSTVNGGGAIGGTAVLSSHVGSLSATGMTVAMTDDGVPGAKPVYWFAIGY